MSTSDQDIIYSDVNIALGQSSSYELLFNEEAIQRAIINIINTRRGSRPFRRRFGSSLMDMLFEPLDEITARLIRTRLMEDIAAHETRVVLDRVEVLTDTENDAYYVEIAGWMPKLESRRFNFNFNLQRRSS